MERLLNSDMDDHPNHSPEPQELKRSFSASILSALYDVLLTVIALLYLGMLRVLPLETCLTIIGLVAAAISLKNSPVGSRMGVIVEQASKLVSIYDAI